VLSVVGQGIPLIYNGQEAGNDRRLSFFERDPIEWREHPMADFYRSLLALKRRNTALWNGTAGATMLEVPNDQPGQVLSFVRQNEQDHVFVVLNLSDRAATVALSGELHHGSYRDHFGRGDEFHLRPWGYRVFVR
jgi:glycosidase